MKSVVIAGAVAVGVFVLPSVPAATAADKFINPKATDMIEWMPTTQSDHRILYDTNPSTFGDLRLPKNVKPGADGYPVVVFLHGGGWTADWTIGHSEQLVEALSNEGIATWNVEYRRLGNAGGGYPGTFIDVAKGLDFLRTIASKYQLNLNRVVVAGHSSGGHLALWLAGRRNLPKTSKLYVSDPLPVAGVVALAAVADLEGALTIGDRKDALQLLHVSDANAAGPLWPETNPMRLLPFGVPQVLIVGSKDGPWRVTITKNFAQVATEKGDNVRLIIPEGANHFDVVHAHGPAYPIISNAVASILGLRTEAAK
jgi:acetyl esterase/lipase